MTKYEHRIRTVLNLRRDETALLCLLLLRGPQTPGELRSRADRMYTFDDLAAVTASLDRLAARPETGGDPSATPDASATGPLVALLPRQPGAREARYAHLLGGPLSEIVVELTQPTGSVDRTIYCVVEFRVERIAGSAGADRSTC